MTRSSADADANADTSTVTGWKSSRRAEVDASLLQIVMSLAHSVDNCLFIAVRDDTEFLSRSMANASTTLYGHFLACGNITPLSGWAMGTTKAGLFYVLVAPRMLALLSLGAMADAEATLNDTILAA